MLLWVVVTSEALLYTSRWSLLVRSVNIDTKSLKIFVKKKKKKSSLGDPLSRNPSDGLVALEALEYGVCGAPGVQNAVWSLCSDV